jgi:hypothetical protein
MSILFCGDIYSENEEFFLDSDLKDLITKSEYSICNFEGAIRLNQPTEVLKAGPKIEQSLEFSRKVINYGFNVFSLANNHIFDIGRLNAVSTSEYFENKGVFTCGLMNSKSDGIFRFQYKDRNFSIISLCESHFLEELTDENKEISYLSLFSIEANIAIQNEKLKSDCVIIYAHGGLETLDAPLTGFSERYRELIDVGANMIIAHHPHIIQGYEDYKESRIYYSLGDFYFSHKKHNRFSELGLMVEIDIVEGELKYREHLIKQINNKVVYIENNGNLLDKLCLKIGDISYLNRKCNQLYNNDIKPLVHFALGQFSIDSGIVLNLKLFLFKVLKRKWYSERRNLLRRHLISNESYSFLLSMLKKDNKIKRLSRLRNILSK